VYTVFDIDGARYDYDAAWPASAPNGVYTPRTGNHATLTFDGQCGYLWTKKSGTTYYFYRPGVQAPCPLTGGVAEGYAGRLYRIIGRNHNTYLTLNYSWDGGNASTSGKISQIAVQSESGLTATLAFADVSGHRLLQQITFPDNATAVRYGYDGQGNLTNVALPANSAGGPSRSETFGYQALATGSVLYWAAGPRWNAACASGCGTDGGWLIFGFGGTTAATSTVSAIFHDAVVNPTIADGTNSGPLQSAYASGATQYLSENYTTGVGTPTFRDTDGHMTNWVVDGLGRPTQTQECTASAYQGQACTGTWLVTNETWDANNNLTSTIDARAAAQGVNSATFQTDYAYDANGNTVAVAEPAVVVQGSSGQVTTRPTKLFSYDVVNGLTNNNVVAYCDEVWTQANARSWDITGNPGSSDSLCPTTAGSAPTPTVPTFAYQYPPEEPFGQLSQSVSATGYHKTYRYDFGPQQGNDFGLPTDVLGDGFTEADGATFVQAHQTFAYDANGNLTSYGPGVGAWSLTYDGLNRLTSAADPDGFVSRKFYFPDGSLSKTETPAQHAANAVGQFAFDAGVLYGYDLDGNVTSETHHHGNLTGTTMKFYDGADRLVEVEQPENDPTGKLEWFTRYLYDLQAGSNVTVAGVSFRAYGGLFDTQENLGPVTAPWRDVRAQEFDALDRMVGKYAFAPGSGTTLRKTAFTYDAANATLGLLSSTADPLGQTTTYDYDAAGRKASVIFGNDGGVTPNRTYVYDAGGRPTRVTSSAYGAQVTRYDADGRVLTVAEGSGGGFTSPAVLGYDYYPDGRRKDLTVQSDAVTASPLITYLYRGDGARTGLTMQLEGSTFPYSWEYTNAGRVTAQYDPYTGAPVPSPPPSIPAGTLYARKQWTYDPNGELASLKLPAVGTYTQIGHDLEGAVASYHVAPYGQGDNTIRLKSNVAGEMASETVQPLGQGEQTLSQAKFDHGTRMVAFGFTRGPHRPSAGYDTVNGVPMGTTTWTVNDSGLQCPSRNTTAESYDAASRHTGTAVVSYDTACTQATGSIATSYDAENHADRISSDTLSRSGEWTGSGFAAAQGWGANGHPVVSGRTLPANPAPGSLHYDGNLLLFLTDASGHLVYMLPELLGKYVPARNSNGPSFAVQDRDFADLAVTAHNQSQFDPVDYFIGAYSTPKQSFSVELSDPGSTLGIGVASWSPYIHPDGFETTFGTIQGTRISDPNTGTWSTPDAYAGDVHDPMSQRRFMWNRNNPYVYSDPSGYAPWWEEALSIAARVFRREAPFASSTTQLEKGLVTSSGSLTKLGARVMGTFREIPLSRGNFGIGSVGDVQQAKALGDIWVGDGAKALSNGAGKISADGSKVFRDPVIKRDGSMQANFEVRDANGNVTANGHLDIRPGGGINVAPSYIRGGVPPSYK
jgi:YD repeat-containing protein